MTTQATVVGTAPLPTASDANYSPAIDASSLYAAIDRSQAVIEFALDGTVLVANRNFLDLLGYRLDEIRGRHHRMFVDPAEAGTAEYHAFWERLGRGEFESAEYKRRARVGKRSGSRPPTIRCSTITASLRKWSSSPAT
jgi:PAS domain S-box-containing protein